MKRMRSLAALRAEHESLTKGHEILFAPKDRGTACVCWRKANGPFPASSSFVTFLCDFRVAGIRHNPEGGNVEAATGEAKLQTRRRLRAPNRRRRFAEVPRFRVPREAPRG